MFLSIPFFVSCSEELFHEHDGEIENCIVLSVQNSSMKTKTDDSNVENLIKTLDLFFYPSNATEANSVYTKHYDFNKVVSGQENLHIYITDAEFARIFPNNNIHTCVVYAIANFPGTVPTADTKLSSLKQHVITATDDNAFVDQDGYPCVPSLFTMYGEQTLSRADANAKTVSGHLPMYRAASKITLRVNLPNSIHIPLQDQNGAPVLDAEGNPVIEEWFPVFDDEEPENGMSNLYLGFHKGLKKGYIDGRLAYPATTDDFFETSEVNDFDYVGEAEYNGVTYNSFACDATFLSFSRMWGQGDVDAPYFILSVPWRRTKTELDNSGNIVGDWLYQTYYYQVQVNPLGRVLTSNHWYDLTLNVGVLGSTVKSEPELLNNCTYFVIDWSHLETISEGNHEEIHLDEWRYLVIDQNRIEMNNTTEAVLPFRASHDIKWAVEWPTGDGSTSIIAEFDELERYNIELQNPYSAYYLDCTSKDPTPTSLSIDRDRDFTKSGNSLKFTYPKSIVPSDKIYSPVYIHLKVWLDIDGEEDQPNDDEVNFVEYVTFVYYPSMYIIPDPSVRRSIYINGEKKMTNSSNEFNSSDIYIGDYRLGSAAGVRNHSANGNTTNDLVDYSMYVICVTAFDETNEKFKTPGTNNIDSKYIIGDPRSRTPDNELDHTNPYVVNTQWADGYKVAYNAQGKAEYSTSANQTMGEFYYPAMTDGDAYRVVAPKFRVVSFNNASRSSVDVYGAAMRCASLQEDGFPAGRWRLPTIAEMQYILQLQKKQVIQPIFTTTSVYYSSSYVNDNKNSRWAIKANADNQEMTYVTVGVSGSGANQTTCSVRCVYDEWYWGSERDAKPGAVDGNGIIVGADGQARTGDDYLYTWGNREIIW